MKTKKLFPFILAFVLAGCVPVLSLNPLYDNQHLVYEDKLIATFTDANDSNVTWGFKNSTKLNEYQLTFTSIEDQKMKKGLFLAYLIKLDGCFFLDVFPKEAPWGEDNELLEAKWPYNSLFFIPAHTFIKIESIEPQLKLWLTDEDDMLKLLKENPSAIGHEIINDKPILTAPTPKLQAFVLKYKDDNRLFSHEIILSRKSVEPNVTCTRDISRDSNQPGKRQLND